MCCIAFSSLAAYVCLEKKKKALVFYPVTLALKWYLVRSHHSCIKVLSESSKLDRGALNFRPIHLNWWQWNVDYQQMCCIAFSSLAAYACLKREKKTLVFYPVMLALKWYLVRIHHSCIEVLSDSSKLDMVALNFRSIHLNWCETLIREV